MSLAIKHSYKRQKRRHYRDEVYSSEAGEAAKRSPQRGNECRAQTRWLRQWKVKETARSSGHHFLDKWEQHRSLPPDFYGVSVDDRGKGFSFSCFGSDVGLLVWRDKWRVIMVTPTSLKDANCGGFSFLFFFASAVYVYGDERPE